MAAGAACTVVTHPLLWYVWPKVVRDYSTYILTGELLVAAVESVIFYALARPIRFLQAVSVSLIANGTSYGLGALLRYLSLLH